MNLTTIRLSAPDFATKPTKIPLIKALRCLTGIGLKEAKDIIEFADPLIIAGNGVAYINLPSDLFGAEPQRFAERDDFYNVTIERTAQRLDAFVPNHLKPEGRIEALQRQLDGVNNAHRAALDELRKAQRRCDRAIMLLKALRNEAGYVEQTLMELIDRELAYDDTPDVTRIVTFQFPVGYGE